MSRSFQILLASGAALIFGFAVLLFFGGVRSTTTSGTGPASTAASLPVIGEVGDFSVTNQAGMRLTEQAFRGRPWAVNLIFTRCPGPCPRLTQVMRAIQDGLPRESRVGLVSLTSDPEHDVPGVLADYAAKFGADTNRWQFVTGSKSEIRRLATERLLLVLQDKPAGERETPEDLFLHGTMIVVVDAEGRVRAVVEGLAPDASAKVLATLRGLEEGRFR